MDKKPRVLLCWGYYRQGWIEVFEKLNDQFEFHYLFWMTKEEEKESYTDCPKYYWTDFKSGREILRKIKPGKVVFMGVNNLQSVGLLTACKRKGVKTYVMQHGLFHDIRTNVYLDQQLAKNKIVTKDIASRKNIRRMRVFMVSFFLRSLGISNLKDLPKMFKWQIDERRMMHLLALAKNHHSFRQADKYIVYTKFNGRFFSETDGITDERMIEIGVPEFDKFFQQEGSYVPSSTDGTYNLLIDSPLTYIEVFKTKGVVSQESYNSFISKLNELSLQQGKRLLIKLHPFSYQNKEFPKYKNIEYVYDCDIVPVIRGAHQIYGLDSTLMLIALYYKPVFLFSINDFSYLQNHLKSIAICPVFDYYNFTVEDLKKAADFQRSPHALQAMIDMFLFKTDGNSFKRVGEALQD